MFYLLHFSNEYTRFCAARPLPSLCPVESLPPHLECEKILVRVYGDNSVVYGLKGAWTNW